MTDIFASGEKLPLIEEFYTVQGEGYHSGKAAYFIRIGGCDIGCRWCDTKISWNAAQYKAASSAEIAKKAAQSPAKSIVVTGGEPSAYNLDFLCSELQKYNLETFVETSGRYPLSGKWDWVCLSPKKQNPPHEPNFALASELKVIVFEDDDFRWAEECAKKVSGNCKLYLQPEWSRHDENTIKIVEFVKLNPQWQISIQAHKFMKIP